MHITFEGVTHPWYRSAFREAIGRHLTSVECPVVVHTFPETQLTHAVDPSDPRWFRDGRFHIFQNSTLGFPCQRHRKHRWRWSYIHHATPTGVGSSAQPEALAESFANLVCLAFRYMDLPQEPNDLSLLLTYTFEDFEAWRAAPEDDPWMQATFLMPRPLQKRRIDLDAAAQNQREQVTRHQAGLKEQVATLVRASDRVRSQLRGSASFQDELDLLRAQRLVKDVWIATLRFEGDRNGDPFLIVQTRPLTVRVPEHDGVPASRRLLGRFRIHIPLTSTNSDDIWMCNLDRTVANLQGAHIDVSGDPCFGTAESQVSELLREGRWAELGVFLLHYLQRVDLGDFWGSHINQWPLVRDRG